MSTRKIGILASRSAAGVAATVLALVIGLAAPSGAQADEQDARRLMKAMSDYLAKQQKISFDYDSNLEVVSKDNQKVALLASGTVNLIRPNKIRATRTGGFSDSELLFDGKTVTFLGKTSNVYAQQNIPGTLDNLIDQLRDKFQRPLPAADLLLSNVNDTLMKDVVDVKDLGSGVVQGVECDHLAFRSAEVDWQIWIAQGSRPYPCQYFITTKQLQGAPQYTVQFRNWKTGSDVAASDFTFKNTTKAKQVDFKDLPNPGDLPAHFKVEARQ
jgi:hypothetical protein